ncbi:MAG TPA: ParA family protein [Gaiellales bacterium]
MHVVAIVNRKGGVGKTTTAVNLAAAIALGSRRALLVDLDPQGSAGVALGVPSADGDDDGSGGMFRGKPRWSARRSPAPSLRTLGVVPADRRLEAEAAAMPTDARRDERFAAALRGAGVMWDVVVIDTPPGLGGLSAAALHAADAVVIPGAADYLSLHALQGTIESVRSMERETRRRYAPLVVLPTFVDARRPGSVAAVALMRDRFGDVVSPSQVPRSARYDSSALAGVPVVVGAPRSSAAVAYRTACDDLVGRLGRKPGKRHGALKGFVRADMREALVAFRRSRPEPEAPPESS